jgi:hypothetical protein
MSRSSSSLGIAANRDFLELDESWPLLLQALELEGFEPSLVLWDDPTVGRFGPCRLGSASRATPGSILSTVTAAHRFLRSN